MMILTSGGLAVAAVLGWPRDTNAMTSEVIEYLRQLAHTCTRLARVCPHLATAHGLEEIALDLMAKAKELEDFQPN
jgi:hypothetical protein